MKVLLHISLIIILLGQLSDKEAKHSVQLVHEPSLVAGDSIMIRIEGDLPKKSTLLLDDGWSYHTVEIHKDENQIITLHPTAAGSNYLYLVGKNGVEAKSKFEVLPQKKVGTIENYLGAKSLEVGSQDYAMIASIVMDDFGNAVPNNTTVEYEFYRNNRMKKSDALTRNGIAYELIQSDIKKSRTQVSGFAGGKATSIHVLNEKSNLPVNFTISATDVFPYTSSQHFFNLHTSKITDRYGNQIEDGTLVEFYITEADQEKRRIQTYTTNGEAKISVDNAEEPGRMIIEAYTLGSAHSNTLSLSFASNITEVPVHLNNSVLTIGPLIGHLGELLPNGTPVTISAKGASQKGTLEKGIFSEQLSKEMLEALTDSLTIEIGSEIFIKRSSEFKK